jgi:hypothetical protein
LTATGHTLLGPERHLPQALSCPAPDRAALNLAPEYTEITEIKHQTFHGFGVFRGYLQDNSLRKYQSAQTHWPVYFCDIGILNISSH